MIVAGGPVTAAFSTNRWMRGSLRSRRIRIKFSRACATTFNARSCGYAISGGNWRRQTAQPVMLPVGGHEHQSRPLLPRRRQFCARRPAPGVGDATRTADHSARRPAVTGAGRRLREFMTFGVYRDRDRAEVTSIASRRVFRTPYRPAACRIIGAGMPTVSGITRWKLPLVESEHSGHSLVRGTQTSVPVNIKENIRLPVFVLVASVVVR